MDTLIKTFESNGKYYMILKDSKRTEHEISKVDFDDINSTNERIKQIYNREKIPVLC